MAAAAEARATLRRLLRAIDRHVTAVAGNTQWRDHALSEFRRTGGSADAAAAQQGLQLARDYAGLIESVAHHRELLSSYNLGLDPDERNKRMVEATARRVGFALPTEEKPPPRKRGGQQEGQQEGQLQREERSSGAPGGLPEARAATNG